MNVEELIDNKDIKKLAGRYYRYLEVYSKEDLEQEFFLYCFEKINDIKEDKDIINLCKECYKKILYKQSDEVVGFSCDFLEELKEAETTNIYITTNNRRELYYQEHKKQIREYYKKYYQEHREELTAKRREYYNKNIEKERAAGRERARKHRQERREYSKKYNIEHKEERKVYIKQWREKNKEHITEYKKKYYEEHKEELKAKRNAKRKEKGESK